MNGLNSAKGKAMPRDCNLVFMALRDAERAKEKRRWRWAGPVSAVGIAAFLSWLVFFA